jgi:hypothetical protein
VSELTVTSHEPVPVQPPPRKPVNVESELGVADSVTLLPSATFSLHVEPQSIPAGVLVTVPEPEPDRVTVSECCAPGVYVPLSEKVVKVKVADPEPEAPAKTPVPPVIE